MELSPIPGVRTYAAVKAEPADFQLSALLDIDAIARPGRGAASGDRKKAAGAEEMEGDDLAPAGDTADTADTAGDAPQSSISFFA
jgi:hypothetical protein